MKKFPEINVSFNELYRIFSGPIQSKLLLTGIELKVFNHLSEPKSSDDVAKAIGTHPENTRLFLDGLTASNLVQKKNGLYQNRAITESFLVEGKSTYLGQFLSNMQTQWFDPALNNLSNLIRGGPPSAPSAPEEGINAEEVWAYQGTLGVNYQRAGIAQQMAEIVSSLPEFPSFKKMLDLGGGPGLIGTAIVGAHPEMKGVIFDQPAVVKVAETFIKEYGMEDRMTVMGGDYRRDPIEEGCDLVWASATLNFARHDMDSLMNKIYDALNPGGVFISFQDGLTHERTKPEIMVLSWMPTALMGQDMGLDQGFIADSMLRVGFKSVRSCTLDTPMGPMDLDIGRK